MPSTQAPHRFRRVVDAAAPRRAVEALDRSELRAFVEPLLEAPDGAAALAAILDALETSRSEAPGWLSDLLSMRDPAIAALVAEARTLSRSGPSPDRERRRARNTTFLDALGERLGLGPVSWQDAPPERRADAALDALLSGPAVDPDAIAQLLDRDATFIERTRSLHAELMAELGVSPRAPADLTLASDLGGALGLSTADGILIDAGRFDPARPEGRALLAHELTHVAQRALPGTAPLAAAEAEADTVMARARAGQTLPTPNVPLSSGAIAACGPQAMNEKKQEDKDKPIPIQGPEPEPITHPEIQPPPQPTPTPEAKPEHDCEACPEPDPESRVDAPVRPTPAAPLTGEGPVRTLNLGGHQIAVRLPDGARAGTVRLALRDVDSPYTGLRLTAAVLTLDEDLTITKGHLLGSLRHGKYVHIPSVHLTVRRNGRVDGAIENALIAVGPTRARVTIRFGQAGIHGRGRIEWQDFKPPVPGITFTSGFLDAEVTAGGAVSAHGRIGITIAGLGAAELEACYVDGELRGSLRVDLEVPIPIIPGVLRITRISATGCFAKGGWRFAKGSVGFAIRDWLEGEAEVSLRSDDEGKPIWTVKGHVELARPASIGPFTLHEARLDALWEDGVLAPLEGRLTGELALPTAMAPVRAAFQGSWDPASDALNGTASLGIDGGLDLGRAAGAGLRLESGLVTGHITDSVLTHIEGQAELHFMYQNLPTFNVRCDRALYDIAADAVHADGALEVLRDVVLGDPEGLHGVFTMGHAGQWVIEYGALRTADAALPFELRQAEAVVGRGGISFSYREDTGLQGGVGFGLVDRLGLPDHADGPVFIEPGGRATVGVVDGALAAATLEGLQVTLAQPGGSGLILGTAEGQLDFGTREASLTCQCWVAEAWTLSLGALGEATLQEGGEAVIGLTHAGIEKLRGKLPFAATLAIPGAGLTPVDGFIDAEWSTEKGTISGDFNVGLGEGAELGASLTETLRLSLREGTRISGHFNGAALSGPLTLIADVAVEEAGEPLFSGSLTDGELSIADGLALSGALSLSLDVPFDLDALGVPLPAGVSAEIMPGGTLSGALNKNAIDSLGVDLLTFMSWDGQQRVQALIKGSWDLTSRQIEGSLTASLLEDTPLSAGDEASRDITAWGLLLRAGSSFHASLGAEGLDEVHVAFIVHVMRGDEAVAEGLATAEWAVGPTDSLTGSARFRMLQAVDLGLNAGRYAVWLSAETQGGLTFSQGAIEGADGSFGLVLVEDGVDKAVLTLEGHGASGGLSGSADLSVRDPITLGAREVGGRSQRVDLATRTHAQVVLIRNLPTTTTGLLALDLVQEDRRFASMDAHLDIAWGQEDAGMTAQGDIEVLAPLALGRQGDFDFLLEPESSVSGLIRDGGVDFLAGSLRLGLARDGQTVARLGLDGRYTGGKVPAIDGTTTLDVLTDFTLFQTDRYRFGFSPSRLAAVMREGVITSASGAIALFAEAVAGEEQAPLGSITMALDGAYASRGPGQGSFSGKGAVTVDGAFPVAQAGSWVIVLGADSGVEATLENNRFTHVGGALKGRVDQAAPGSGESGPVLAFGGQVSYRPDKGGQVDADGKATIIGRKRVHARDGMSFWLAPVGAGGSATVKIIKNKLISVSGQLGGEVHKDDAPLMSAQVKGDYDGETGQLSGSGRLRLLSSLTVPPGRTSGFRLELLPGTEGTAEVDKGEIKRLKGAVALRILDDNGALFEVTGRGELDAAEGKLVEASGQASLIRPFDIGGEGEAAMLRLTSASGKARVANNALEAIEGQLAFTVPRIPGATGSLAGGWTRGAGDEADVYWGEGTLSMVLPDKSGAGRDIQATLGLKVNKGGGWEASGQTSFRLIEGLDIDVGVAMDQTLDPAISAAFRTQPAEILPAATLFKTGFNMSMDVPIAVGVGVGFGVGLGVEAGTQPLTFAARGSFSNWRPLSSRQSVPDFEAELAITWGLGFKLNLSAFAELFLGLGGVLSLNAGVEAGLDIDIPLTLSPTGRIFGGPDGVGGEIDLAAALKASGALNIKPYVSGTVLGGTVGPAYLAELHNDLGTLFEWSWAKRYSFGDKPKAPEDIAPPSEVASGSTTERPERLTAPKEHPEQAPTAPAAKAGGPNISAIPDGKGRDEDVAGDDGLAKMMTALEALQGLMQEIQPYLKMIEEDGIRGAIKALGKATAKPAWERICKKARAFYHALNAAFPDMDLAYTLPMWVIDIMESPEGESLSLWDAWYNEDVRVRERIAEGKHLSMPLAGRVQFANALMSGYCSGSDSEAVLVLIRHAIRVGDVDALISGAGGWKRVHGKLGLAHGTIASRLLEADGYFERVAAAGKAFWDDVRGRMRGMMDEAAPTQEEPPA